MAAAGTIGAVVAVALLSYLLCNHYYRSTKPSSSSSSSSRRKASPSKNKPRNGLIDAIGNTPLIRINSLSEATGCEV